MGSSRTLYGSWRGRSAALIGVTGMLLAFLAPSTVGAVTASATGTGYVASLIQTPAAGTLLAVNSATDTIYLATATGVTVVNGATNSVTTTIATAAPVYAIAADPATNTVYLAASPVTGPEIQVINGATNVVTKTISMSGLIYSLAVDTATDTVYGAEPGLDQVAVINGATNTVTTNIGTGTGIAPYHLAVDEASDTVWATVQAGSLIAIDGATNAVASDIALAGTEPYSVAVDSGTDTIYVTDLRNGQVIVLDGSTGKISTLISIGQYLDVDVDQSSGLVYASSAAGPTGTTWVINGSTNQIEDSIGRGSIGVVVDQSTGVVYEPAFRAAAIWILTPGTANAMSPFITTGGAASFTVGSAGSFTETVSALPAASFREAGPLPTGLSMSASGVISGTPAAGTGGLYPITVTASNGVAPDYSQQFELSNYQAPAITSGNSATFQVGTAGSFPLTATGYTAPAFSDPNSLPAGLLITDHTPGGWEISGTPAVGTGGVYRRLTIFADNGVSPEAQQTFTLTINEAPSITSAAHATFLAGKSGGFQVVANGYPLPTCTEVGVLPRGLSLSSTGLLVGTPVARSRGVYPITIMASNGISPAAHQAFRLNIDQAPAFTSARSATFKVGHLRKFTIRTTGFPAARLSERGRLPAGITFKKAGKGTALLVGRASRSDRRKTYVIIVIARNGTGPAVRETFRLKVS